MGDCGCGKRREERRAQREAAQKAAAERQAAKKSGQTDWAGKPKSPK